MAEFQRDFRDFVLAALVQYETRLVRYSTRLLFGNQDRARDIVQHAFLKLCEQPPDSVRDRVGPWLFRVCRNRVIDELRRDSSLQQVLDQQLDLPDVRQQDPQHLVESADVWDFIQQLIAQLPMAQQEIVELWSNGISHDEIARIVDKKPGAVRGALHRAMKTLKANERVNQWLRDQSGTPDFVSDCDSKPRTAPTKVRSNA